MKIVVFLALFLPGIIAAQAEFTSPAVADSINEALVALGYDTTPAPMQCLYYPNDSFYIYLGDVPGAQFLALSPYTGPTVLISRKSGTHRAWHRGEIENWLQGATGTKYESTDAVLSFLQYDATITISGDTWTGRDAK